MNRDRRRISLDEIRELARCALEASGFSTSNAAVLADVITAAERDDCPSHGLFRVPFYCETVAHGAADGHAVSRVEVRAPEVLAIDAAHGFAPPAVVAARERIVDMARRQGVMAAAVVNAFHTSALWYDVEWLAGQGLVAFAFVNSKSFLAPEGGTGKLFGTNPMAFAWPRPDAPPVVFDQASSMVARGEIQLHLRDGRPVPPGWGLDAGGRPSTDPAAILDGAQLPFGGHKGSAIAMMVELMTGGLTAGPLAFEQRERDPSDTRTTEGGETLLVIDPAHFAPGGDARAAIEHADRLFERLLAQEGTRLPSDRRYAARAHAREHGVSVSGVLLERVRALAAGR